MTESENGFVRCEIYHTLFDDLNEHQDTCAICKSNEELRERLEKQQEQKDRDAGEPYILFQDVVSTFFKWWFSTSMGDNCPSEYVSRREPLSGHQPVASHAPVSEHDTVSDPLLSPESL